MCCPLPEGGVVNMELCTQTPGPVYLPPNSFTESWQNIKIIHTLIYNLREVASDIPKK